MLPSLVLSLLLAVSVTDAGVSFIRWGRTVCPAGSQALYKGYTAGPKWDSGGSGSNFLCMHEKPKFVGGTAGTNNYAGLIFGTKIGGYLEFSKDLLSSENMPNGILNHQNVPCVRCYVAGSSDSMLVPGRPDCGDSGYDLMYSGILMSEYRADDRKRSEYICVDHAPEGSTGSGENDSKIAVLYPVEISCGALPCNPYSDGMEATCAVCTY